MGRACSLPSPPRYAPGGRRRFGAGQSPAPKPKARPGAKAPGRAFAGALRPRRPPRDAAVSCALPAHPFPQHPRHHFDFLRSPGPSSPPAPPAPLRFPIPPTRSPTLFPSVTHHTPKAFWKPPKAVSKAEPFAALGEAPLTPFASPGEAHAPSALHFRPATSQGSGGGAAPSRGSRGAAAPGLGGANITKYLLPNPYRNLHLSPYLHIKRPPLGRWHKKPSPLGGLSLKNP